MTVAGAIRWADDGQRTRVRCVTSLSKNLCLCSYVLIHHLFSWSPMIMGVFHNHLHSFLWFPILDRAIAYYKHCKEGNVFFWLVAGNME
jgi:hypothetical protein